MEDHDTIETFPWTPCPTKDIGLSNEDVHVWCLPLRVSKNLYQSLSPILSIDEISRARRFRIEKDRHCFTVKRAFLRTIISYYTDLRPQNVVFSHNGYGKPSLDPTLDSNASINFNTSRSSDVAIFAITRNRDVGIDIEKIRDIDDIETIVEDFFPDVEKRYFSSLASEKKLEVFYVLWTRMEAVLKAQGIGFLSSNEGRIDLVTTLIPEYEKADMLKWRIWSFCPMPGYIASFALDGQAAQITCFDLNSFEGLL